MPQITEQSGYRERLTQEKLKEDKKMEVNARSNNGHKSRKGSTACVSILVTVEYGKSTQGWVYQGRILEISQNVRASASPI